MKLLCEVGDDSPGSRALDGRQEVGQPSVAVGKLGLQVIGKGGLAPAQLCY